MRGLEDIKVGDRVWVTGRYASDKYIQPVERLTPKQIVLGGRYTGKAAEEYNRYWRGRKTRWGDELDYSQARKWGEGRIAAIATRAECQAWDIEQARKAESAAAKRAEEERLEAKRIELQNLFAGNAVGVGRAYHTAEEAWQVQVEITEAQVRQLANLWNAMNEQAKDA